MSSSDEEATIKEKRKEKKEKRDEEKAKQKEIIAENQEKLKKSSTAVLAGGSVFTLISLTFLCVSFGTSEWIVYTVDSSYTKSTVSAAAKDAVSTATICEQRRVIYMRYWGNIELSILLYSPPRTVHDMFRRYYW